MISVAQREPGRGSGIPPIFNILRDPTGTINRILSTDPNTGVMILGVLGGVTTALRTSTIHGLHPLPDLIGYHPVLDDIIQIGVGPSAGWMMTMVSVFVYGSTIGTLILLFGSILYRLALRAISVKISFHEARSIVAWSFAPYTYFFLFWAAMARFGMDHLRVNSYPFGALFPWHLDLGLGSVLALDYIMRFGCVFFLITNTSRLLALPLWKTALAVLTAFIPFSLWFIATQRFGF